MKAKSKQKTIDALQQLRLSLLEPGADNPLLHSRHPGQEPASLWLFDEMPDCLAARLLAGQTPRLLPVPRPGREALAAKGYLRLDAADLGEEETLRPLPDAEEWASCLGLARALNQAWELDPGAAVDLGLDMPEHGDDLALEEELPAPAEETGSDDPVVQSLHFPDELEARLRSLAQAAESLMEETGAGGLYLAVGFLEWSASVDETSSLAPLLLLPVLLQRDSAYGGGIDWRISVSGEDALCNPLLWEKLRADFGLSLPEPVNPFLAEDYFSELISLIAASQPQWTVRPFILLGLFQPHDMILYRDLAPERWPGKGGIARHPLLQLLLARPAAGEPAQRDVGTIWSAPDPAPEETTCPLIMPADSAQLRALLDALTGTSMVIEGPPGCGKSQTIANLIALALAMDKKVLFVAEKRAALEVVWRRLDRSGLGLFCLELHSWKLTRDQMLNTIQDRLEWQGQCRSPEDIDTELALYAEEREKLSRHAEVMERNWGRTGESVRRIFASAARCRAELQTFTSLSARDLHPRDLDGESLDPDRQTRLGKEVVAFAKAYERIADRLPEDKDLSRHPWHGVGSSGPDPLTGPQIQQRLDNWQQSLRQLSQLHRQTLERFAGSFRDTEDSLTTIAAFQQELALVPRPQGKVLFDLAGKLQGEQLGRCREYQHFFEKILAGFADLARVLPPQVMQNLDEAPSYLSGCKSLIRLVAGRHSLTTLDQGVERLVDLQRELAEMQFLMEEIGRSMGEAASACLTITEEGLADFRDCILLAGTLPEACWSMRHTRFDQDELDAFLFRLSDDLQGLHLLRETLQSHFCLERLPDKYELRRLRVQLEQGGPLRRLNPSWQEERKALLALAPEARTADFKTMFDLLPRAEELAAKLRELHENEKYYELLGPHMLGMDTDIQTLKLLRSWYQTVRKRFGRGSGGKAGLGGLLLSLPADLLEAQHDLHGNAVPRKIDALLEALAQMKEVFPPLALLRSTDMLLHEGKGSVAVFIRSLLGAVHACQPIVTDSSMSVADLYKLSQRLARLHEAVTVWEKSDPDQRFFQGRLGLQPRADSQNSAGLASLRNTLDLAAYLTDEVRDPLLRSYLRDHPENGFVELHRAAEELDAGLKAERDSFAVFRETTELASEVWLRETDGRLSRILARNEKALQAQDELPAWLEYVQCRARIVRAGLAWLPPVLEGRGLRPDQAMAAHRAGMYDLLEREILDQSPELTPFAGTEQDILQQEMARYVARQKELRVERMVWRIEQTKVPQGQEGVREDELTDLACLRHECANRRHGSSLRQLFQRASAALQALHPCWMASPPALARYLEPGGPRFDLVIVDEASQIRLASALGAVARGAQLVVTGDPRQLTPRFPAPSSPVSLLDAALATLPVHRLARHYRSRHEELIAFANQTFYGGRLLPQSLTEDADCGIRWHRVEHGHSHGGESREAVIAREVREHLCSQRRESLGVVAMNQAQRQLIADNLNDLAEHDELFRARLAQDSLHKEPLLLKSAAHIQGDERDVLFILLTCEPSADREGEPDFGPLGGEEGWRCLNVLLTRARKRMHIFTSMEAADAFSHLRPESPRGLQEFCRFMEHCEDNSLEKTWSALAVDGGGEED